MNVVIVGWLCSLIVPAYFILLMADARKLERALLKRRVEFNKDARDIEGLL